MPLHTLHTLASLLLLTFLTSAVTAPAAEATFTFTVLEIPDIQRGAGLAIVMRTPSGKTWLYDTSTAHAENSPPTAGSPISMPGAISSPHGVQIGLARRRLGKQAHPPARKQASIPPAKLNFSLPHHVQSRLRNDSP
jgi:hypothetical protein